MSSLYLCHSNLYNIYFFDFRYDMTQIISQVIVKNGHGKNRPKNKPKILLTWSILVITSWLVEFVDYTGVGWFLKFSPSVQKWNTITEIFCGLSFSCLFIIFPIQYYCIVVINFQYVQANKYYVKIKSISGRQQKQPISRASQSKQVLKNIVSHFYTIP